MGDVSVNNLHLMSQNLVLQRLVKQVYPRITIDTGRYAEGTAIGFNKKKKGQRSYYPLVLYGRANRTGAGHFAPRRECA
jgi:hypothetical protein